MTVRGARPVGAMDVVIVVQVPYFEKISMVVAASLSAVQVSWHTAEIEEVAPMSLAVQSMCNDLQKGEKSVRDSGARQG